MSRYGVEPGGGLQALICLWALVLEPKQVLDFLGGFSCLLIGCADPLPVAHVFLRPSSAAAPSSSSLLHNLLLQGSPPPLRLDEGAAAQRHHWLPGCHDNHGDMPSP